MNDYNPYNPMIEGEQRQRLEPQVELLVMQALRIGEQKNLNELLRKETKAREAAEESLGRYKYDYNQLKSAYAEAEALIAKQEKKIKRLTPKTPFN
jgi:hypothetical protein